MSSSDLPKKAPQSADASPEKTFSIDSFSSGPSVFPIGLGPPSPLRMDFAAVREILPHLIDSLSDAVLIVDRDRRVVASNAKYIEAFGAHLSEVVGQTCHDAVSCPDARTGKLGGCAACEVLSQRRPQRMIRTLSDPGGAMHRWEGTLNPVIDGGGDVSHVVEIWRDISERTRLESQLSHSERLAALGMLAAGVAHEINNPLASILAGVDSLRRWLERTPEVPAEARADAQEVVDVLERSVQRTRDITDKLMLLAQPVQAAPVWVDLNRAVRDTLGLLGFQMRKQGVEASEQLDLELPNIWARGGGMRSMLMNLCLNAVQAMPSGGVLEVRTSRLGVDRVRIEIKDTGTGIDPIHRNQIWNPFFTTKPVGQGTGLGLSITQRIVQRHGGQIRLDSELGQGATFTIDLPVRGPGGDHV